MFFLACVHVTTRYNSHHLFLRTVFSICVSSRSTLRPPKSTAFIEVYHRQKSFVYFFLVSFRLRSLLKSSALCVSSYINPATLEEPESWEVADGGARITRTRVPEQKLIALRRPHPASQRDTAISLEVYPCVVRSPLNTSPERRPSIVKTR